MNLIGHTSILVWGIIHMWVCSCCAAVTVAWNSQLLSPLSPTVIPCFDTVFWYRVLVQSFGTVFCYSGGISSS